MEKFITTRLEKYVFTLRQKLQEAILRKEPTDGTLPDRILRIIEKDPVAVDTILFDGYMLRATQAFEIKKRNEEKEKPGET